MNVIDSEIFLTDKIKTWDNIWNDSKNKISYSFLGSRRERGKDKIGYFIQQGVKFCQGDKVLDAGCGDGSILLALLSIFKIKAFGVDFSKEAQKNAIKLMLKNEKHFEFSLANVEAMPYPKDYFDKILSLGVIEHFKKPEKSIRELFRVLKPGGTLVLMTPNRFSFGSIERIFKVAIGKWKFGYQTEYSVKNLSTMLANNNFKLVKSDVLLRRRMRKDNSTFKFITYMDQLFNLFHQNWGFYSYIFATKQGESYE